MPRFHVLIEGSDSRAMLDLVRRHRLTVARQSIREVPGGFRIDGHASDDEIRALEATGYRVIFPTPGFVDWCAGHFRRMAPVHEWLLERVVRGGADTGGHS